MRRYGLMGLLALLLLAPAAPAAAQDERPTPRTVEDADLPEDVARRITDFFNDPETIHFTGATRIPAERTVSGDVAVLGGPLTVAGRIEGDVVVINGDVEFLPGASVTGDVTVVGGDITGAGDARVGGEMTTYSARLRYDRRGERIVHRERRRDREVDREIGRDDDPWDDADEDEQDDHSGRADFIVATGQSYNRVEGLPITFGPVFETEGANPFRLRVMGIFRTEGDGDDGDGARRWGVEARAEQFFGGNRVFRLGATGFHKVDPIEDWHLTKLENGLSTFFLHEDFRDHYERQGFTAYAMLTPPNSGFTSKLEFRAEQHRPLVAGSPWTLFDNDDPWRPQPLAARGDLSTLAFQTRIDTRDREDDPSTGWFVSTEVEQALSLDLERAALVTPPLPPGGGGTVIPVREYDRFTRGFVDIRRYNRINASSRLNFRLLGGGSIDGSTLPPQRQHALGGEGSLPGFGLFSMDCGARDIRVSRDGTVATSSVFFPAYGCDRFVLGQVEYRGDLSFGVDVGDWHDHDDDEDDGEGDEDWEDDPEVERRSLRADLQWVLFSDVGRGWSLDPLLRDEETRADVGFGLVLGQLGFYAALPVAGDDGGRGVNFFIRLNSRF
ncbi:MAG TPA: polymer-forming cytoskeletal protein [Longimicrobiaceae bacterium]|nr:polymer-forming cytoskeletal protein [Longimicrobiaceae bacterium]